MDEASSMEAETAANDRDANNSPTQPKNESDSKLDGKQQLQDDKLKSDACETTNSSDVNSEGNSQDETKENMNVQGQDGADQKDVNCDNNENIDSVTKAKHDSSSSNSNEFIETDLQGERNLTIENSDDKSPIKNTENTDPSNTDQSLTKSVTSPGTSDGDALKISEDEKAKNQDRLIDASDDEVNKGETSKTEGNNSPDQTTRPNSSNSVSEVDDDSMNQEIKKTDTVSKPETELSASQEQALLESSDTAEDDTAEDISIDLEPSNGADDDQEGSDGGIQEGSDGGIQEGSDGGIQEVHDVEEEMEDEKSVGGDHQNMDVVAHGKPHFLSQPQQIQELVKQVSGLQAELEMTQKKLAKAEKKLGRTRRHKESSESYNYDLRKRVKHLKKELHRCKKDSKKTFAEVGCQTSSATSATAADDLEGQDDVIEIPSTSSGSGMTPRFWGGAEEDEHQSLADSLKATAEAALSSSGYVLDPNSGLYYDYSTGYYYDPNNHLYYDPSTGVYYFYDQTTRTYQFHSQVDVDPSGMIPQGGWDASRPRKGKRRRDKRSRRDASERDDMECEVIEVLDDDSPENKRPKKAKRKRKGSGKAPHTATSHDDNNEDKSGPETASKDTEEQIPTEGEMEDPESASPTKEKSRRKKKTPKKRSADQKASKVDEEGSDKIVGESSMAIDEDEAQKNNADATKGDDDKSADEESSKEKDKDAKKKEDSNQDKETEDKAQKDDSKPSTSDPKSPSQPSTSQGEKKSDDKENEAKSDSAHGEETISDDSPPHASDKKDAESGNKDAESGNKDAESGNKDADSGEKEEGQVDDEIMEVESKRKEEIEEITILDSDSDDSDMEEGELSDSSAEDLSSSDDSSELESDDIPEQVLVTRQDFPPCIRMIVTRSDKIQLGSLFVVTCTGGTIGREGTSHIVTIPELGVSKHHAEIKYNETLKLYCITDLGSQNGTLINGKMLSKARSVSEPHPVSHKDYLTVGSTTLRLHIHPGSDTCDECEPGQVQALIAQLNPDNNQVTYALVSQADKEQMRRKELRKLKKKYNLVKDNYRQQDPSTSNAAYTDRAGARRQTVGSDNPYQSDDAPASVDRAIGESNVGRKMLEKMGWKEGKGLGKKDAGITEPIQVLVHDKNSGLGANMGVSMDQAQYMTHRRKNARWQKTKARFDKLQQQDGQSSSSTSNVQWVKGGTVTDKNGLYGDGEEDDVEECIEILSPGSDEGTSPMEDNAPGVSTASNATPTETMSISSTSTTETVTTVEKSSSGAEATTVTSASTLSTEPRPKIQLKIMGKKGKEQLPISSVVLDDGDEEEEEMDVTQSNNRTDSSVSTGKDTTVNGQEATKTDKDKGNNKENSSTQDDSLVTGNHGNTALESNEGVPKVGTVVDKNATISCDTPAESQGTELDSVSAKGASNSTTGKWVTVGAAGNNDDTNQVEGDGDAPHQESEAGGSEAVSKTDDAQSETQTGRKTRTNKKQSNSQSDTGTGSNSKKTDSQTDSESPTKGRKRRTRQSAKKNEEDMFADL